MTIFDYLKDITVTKRGDLPLDEYIPFLVNRWLSFLNPTVAEMINLNFNIKTLLENKEIHYKLLLSVFPKLKSCPRISYIKKIKEDKTEEDIKIKILAEKMEISKREVRMLMGWLD